MIITFKEMKEVFEQALRDFETDLAEYDPEFEFLTVVENMLNTINMEIPEGDYPQYDEMKLNLAIQRVPGILHLYKLY